VWQAEVPNIDQCCIENLCCRIRIRVSYIYGTEGLTMGSWNGTISLLMEWTSKW